MSIFDDINKRISDIAVGNEAGDAIPIAHLVDPFQNAESIRANQPLQTPRSASDEGVNFKHESVATPEVVRSHAANPSAVMKRYKDAYAVANIANGFGKLTKTLGIIVAGLIILAGLIFAAYAAGSSSNSFGIDTSPGPGAGLMMFFVFSFWGVFWGAIVYLLGVVLSALGQNLMASLDTAVYNSPFLTDEQKAWAMGVQL